jgi:ISXO2-like transposase domain
LEAIGHMRMPLAAYRLDHGTRIDGAYFGGKIKPENRKADRRDRRIAEEQTGKRQVVVVAREALGRTCRSLCRARAERCP